MATFGNSARSRSGPPTVGIFGGTFDPIHFGHLRPAQEAFRALALSTLRFVPANQSPHRPLPVAAARQRLAMVRMAIAGMAGFEVDDREVRRGGLSYMVDTLESLQRDLPGSRLVLLIGFDQFRNFDRWHRWLNIRALCRLAVLSRPGFERQASPPWAAGLDVPAAELGGADAGRLAFLEVQPQDISASRIRERLARGGPVTGLLPDAVIEYLEANSVYPSGEPQHDAV